MFQKFLHRLSAPTEAIGLDVYVRPDGENEFHAVWIKREANTFKIHATREWTGKLNDISSFANNSIPIALSISGKGTLVKQVNNANPADAEIIQRVLPNAKAADFHIQILPSGKNCFVALQRNEVSEIVIKEIITLGYQIGEVSLGGLQVAHLGLALNIPSPWKISHYHFQYSSEFITDYQHQYQSALNNPITFAGDSIQEKFLPAFCSGLQYLAESSISKVEKPLLDEQRKEIRAKRLRQKSLWGILLFFFFALLINFVVFSNLSVTNNSLRIQASSSSSLLKELDVLEKEVSEKNTFLTETGWLSNSKFSFFSDKIASTIPSEISLSQISFQPLDDKNSKLEKKKIFESGLIKVEGFSQKATSMNEWIETLKLIPNIQSVKLLRYQYNDQERKGSFEIQLRFNS